MDGSAFHYWGKAKPDASGVACHLLPYHCLDVAAVGQAYFRSNTALSRFFMRALGCSEQVWLNWSAFWLAIHDIGKFSESFQSQKPELFVQWHGRPPSPDRPYTVRHDSLGHWIWKGLVFGRALDEHWFGHVPASMRAGLDAWARAVTGHHGQPPVVSGSYVTHFSEVDEKVVADFVTAIRHLLLPAAAAKLPACFESSGFEKTSQRLSWWFAGVSVLADWLGSNTHYFPYCDQIVPLEQYWLRAQQQAERVLADAGILPVAVQESGSLSVFFPYIGTPSPLQGWADAAEITPGPQLYFLEDVTGAGKTEAAVTLAYRLMRAGEADGFFVGLPTMATANAMYARLAGVYRNLFGGNPSLVLAHGSKRLVDDFACSVLPADVPEHDSGQRDDTATARCTAWLADHNKRALLAPAGVGTIDQALLAVLHSRHQSLRLLGLFRKVLIVDEVHACDAYMQRVLEVLLYFHAQAGGSVILLSATLPGHMKKSLADAFARGVGMECVPDPASAAYPLVTAWQSSNPSLLVQAALASRAEVSRRVIVDYRSSVDQVERVIVEALQDGKSVCWIRNTVADAVEASERLSVKRPAISPLLFHARFSLHDRLQIEGEVLSAFGNESGPAQRFGRLVVATQVIEQSLDVDFDLLVSDLAPIDRLLQRAGRLHRHVRDVCGNRLSESDAADARGIPRMVVYGPAFTDSPDGKWFRSVFPGGGAVYPDHGQLWRTAREIQTGSFRMPADARRLIEAVFAKDDCDLPEGLRAVSERAEGQALADASIAHNNTLKFGQGYARGDVVDWWSDARTPSRLGEATRSVLLARWVEGRLVPWVECDHAWAYSTVRVAERLIHEAVVPSDASRRQEYGRVLASLPDEGRWSLLLPLDSVGDGVWTGWALPPATRGGAATEAQQWLYDERLGLRRAGNGLQSGGGKK
jgi:CRISPR-associated endonuclease/helicase Cas3